MMTLLRMAFPFLFKVRECEIIVEDINKIPETTNTKTKQLEKPKHKHYVELNVIINKNDTSSLKWCNVEITTDGKRLDDKKELATGTSINLLIDDIMRAMYDINFSYNHREARNRIASKINLFMSSVELIPYKHGREKICISVNIIKR